MFRTIATTVLPWILLVGVIAWVELRDQARTAVPEATDGLALRVADLEREVARLRETVAVEGRLRPSPGVPAPRPTPPPPGDAPAAPDAPGTGTAGEVPPPLADAAAVAALRERLARGTVDAALIERVRTDPAFAKLLAEQEAAVREDPDDVQARMHLADAYVLKLYAVPDGPARGEWAQKAEGQWREVLAREGSNWEARFSLATSLSQWPSFFGKAPDAIAEYETLRRQQEGTRPEPRHAETYVNLAQLYLGRGDREKAEAVLREGTARHPDDARLKKLLEGL